MVFVLTIAMYVAVVYIAIGVLLLIPMHRYALPAMDDAVVGAGIGFRVLITPSLVALWPIVAMRWWRAGAYAAPKPEDAVSAAGLRAMQRHLTRAVAVVIPLLIGPAIMARDPAAIEYVPDIYRPQAKLEDGTPLADLDAHYGIRYGSILEVEVHSDLESPATVIYLDTAAGDSLSSDAKFLGSIWGPASLVYELPAPLPDGLHIKVYSVGDSRIVAQTALQVDEADVR